MDARRGSRSPDHKKSEASSPPAPAESENAAESVSQNPSIATIDDASRSNSADDNQQEDNCGDNSNSNCATPRDRPVTTHDPPTGGDIEAPPPIRDVVRGPPANDDDVSTLANETFVGVVDDPRMIEAVPPLSVVTPLKQSAEEGHGKSRDSGKKGRKKRKDGGKDAKDNGDALRDDATQPETPEKDDEAGRGGYAASFVTPFAGIDPAQKNRVGTELPPSAQERPRCCSLRSRFTACLSVVLAITLAVGIGILGYTLYEVRNDEDPTLFSFSLSNSRLFGKKNSESNDGLSDTPTQPGDGPSHDLSEAQILAGIKATILLAAPDSSEALADASSLQYNVVEWLVNDPFVETYTRTKIIQRYALGCFFWSLNGGSADGTVVLSSSIADTWMTYSDECTNWGTTADRVCDERGRMVSLSLDGVGLSGTLASEIALLSNSLEIIFLTMNDVQGEIPAALGQMSKLKRIQISRNKLTGSLPTTLGRLTDLEILSAASNQLSGSMPTQLGRLTNLFFLSLDSNNLTGTLPSELGDLVFLDFLSVQSNGLVGQIPEELSQLNELSTFWISGNDFVGAVPSGICSKTTGAVGLDISVDCEEVACSCCIDCATDSAKVQDQDDATAVPTTENVTFSISDTPVASNNITDDSTTANQTGVPGSGNVANDAQNTNSSLPYPIDVNNETPDPPNFSCYDIQVGFDCYETDWAIDFETGSCNPRNYNLVAVYPSPNTTGDSGTSSLQTSSSLGSLVSMSESLFWATSCELQACDGVVSGGTVYYRNQFPDQTATSMEWPLPSGQYVLRIILSDEFGNATVLAESAAFVVADQC